MPELRPTKDIDLLGHSISNELEDVTSPILNLVAIVWASKATIVA